MEQSTITYRDLLNSLTGMSDTILNQTVTIYDTNRDEYLPAFCGYIKKDSEGVLDDYHYVIEIEG